MGKGKALDSQFVLRLIELLLLITAIIVFMVSENDRDALVLLHLTSFMQAVDALCMTTSIYVIILFIILGLKLIKGEDQDDLFLGWLFIVGTILLISTGIAVCVKNGDDSAYVLTGGVMAILGGVTLSVDALMAFGIF